MRQRPPCTIRATDAISTGATSGSGNKKRDAEASDRTGCGTGPDGLSWDIQSCRTIVSNIAMSGMFIHQAYSYDSVVAYCQRRWGITPTPLAVARSV